LIQRERVTLGLAAVTAGSLGDESSEVHDHSPSRCFRRRGVSNRETTSAGAEIRVKMASTGISRKTPGYPVPASSEYWMGGAVCARGGHGNKPHNPKRDSSTSWRCFRRESDEAVQHLYAYLTMHAVAGDHKEVRQLLQFRAALLAHHASRSANVGLHCVGRIFSQDSEHNLDALLGIASRIEGSFRESRWHGAKAQSRGSM